MWHKGEGGGHGLIPCVTTLTHCLMEPSCPCDEPMGYEIVVVKGLRMDCARPEDDGNTFRFKNVWIDHTLDCSRREALCADDGDAANHSLTFNEDPPSHLVAMETVSAYQEWY